MVSRCVKTLLSVVRGASEKKVKTILALVAEDNK